MILGMMTGLPICDWYGAHNTKNTGESVRYRQFSFYCSDCRYFIGIRTTKVKRNIRLTVERERPLRQPVLDTIKELAEREGTISAQ